MKNKYFFILILVLFSIFWIWWLPGPRVANDFSFISNDWLKLQFDIPRAWNERGAEGLGEYGVFTLWSYPINLIFGILAYLGLNFQIWERILVILYIFLGSLSIWKFLSQYTLSNKSKFIGSLFYLINTYPILLIDGGQLSIALAYGLFPLAYCLTLEAVYSARDKKILAGLVISALGFFDIRFLFILFLLLLLRALFDILEGKYNRFKILWKWISTSLVTGLVVLTLNSFWLIAIVKTPLEKDILSSFTKISANLFNIGHPILVISPHWYKNIFGRISDLKPEFILLPILVLLAPILRKKDKIVLFWLIIAVFSIFLAKGGAKPLSSVFLWLHSNIVGFSFFRDSTKFFFLITLSYSVLISIASEEIFNRVLNRKKLAIFYFLFIIAYFIYLMRPVFLNQMTGSFSIQPFEKEFQSLSKVLQNDKNFGRVFWIPTTSPLSYSDSNHPIVEAARVFNRKPFTYGVKGAYETFNFLREAPYMGEIFDIAGISYIAYPYLDSRRDNSFVDNTKYYYTFLNQLTFLSWIEKRISESKAPLLKTKSHQDKIFITNNTWIVFGSDEVFNEATKSAKLRLSNNAIIFAEYKPEIGSLISKYPEAKIVLNKKTNTDLIASFIPDSKMIFPARRLTATPDEAGWWKNDGTDLISWRDFLQTKYAIDSKEFDLGGGWAVGEGGKEYQIVLQTASGRANIKYQNGDILFARVMESSRSGSLSFYQDNQEIGKISTLFAGNANIRWFEVGNLAETADLIIKTEGDINVINALATVDPENLAKYKKTAEDLKKQIKDFKPDNAAIDKPLVSYEKINQTKYKVIISNLTNPEILVFSSTFHPLWQLNGEGSVPAYGFLNGFRVAKDGEYILEFEPQKYVKKGLVISLLSFILIIYLLLTLKRKHN